MTQSAAASASVEWVMIFEEREDSSAIARQPKLGELLRQIGQLYMELDWLRKAVQIDGGATHLDYPLKVID